MSLKLIVRTTIGARSCPRKECLDHLETGFKLTNAYPKVSVAIWVMFWQSNHELWRKNSQKRRFKVTKRRIWTQPLYEGLGLWNFLSGQRIVQICSANFGIVSIFCSYLIRAVQTCETICKTGWFGTVSAPYCLLSPLVCFNLLSNWVNLVKWSLHKQKYLVLEAPAASSHMFKRL